MIPAWKKALAGASADGWMFEFIPDSSTYDISATSSLCIDDNNVYAFSPSDGGSGYAAVIAVTHIGDVLWARKIKESTDNYERGEVAINPSNGDVVIATLATVGTYPGVSIISLSETDGSVNWARHENDSGGAFALPSLCCDSSGNTLVAFLKSGVSYIIQQYNSSGTFQWDHTLGISPTSGQKPSVTVDSSNNVFVLGSSGSPLDIYLYKINSSGVLQWDLKMTDSTNNMLPGEVTVDSSGNPIFLLRENSSYYVGIVKCSTSGSVTWQKKLDSSDIPLWMCVTTDSDDNIYILVNDPTAYYSLIKLDSSGNEVFQRKITGITPAQNGFDGIAGRSLIFKNNNLYLGLGDAKTVDDMVILKCDSYGDLAGTITGDNTTLTIAVGTDWTLSSLSLTDSVPGGSLGSAAVTDSAESVTESDHGNYTGTLTSSG